MSPAFKDVMYEKNPGIYGINCILLCTKLMMHFCVCFIILICVNNHIYFIIFTEATFRQETLNTTRNKM